MQLEIWGKPGISAKLSLRLLLIHHECPMRGSTFHVFQEVTFHTVFQLLQDPDAIAANRIHGFSCRGLGILGVTATYCECPAQSLEERQQLGDAGYGAQGQQGESGIPGNSLWVVWVLQGKKKKNLGFTKGK